MRIFLLIPFRLRQSFAVSYEPQCIASAWPARSRSSSSSGSQHSPLAHRGWTVPAGLCFPLAPFGGVPRAVGFTAFLGSQPQLSSSPTPAGTGRPPCGGSHRVPGTVTAGSFGFLGAGAESLAGGAPLSVGRCSPPP